MNLKAEIENMGQLAKTASRELALLSTQQKNTILTAMTTALEQATNQILQANQLDLIKAQKTNLSSALIDRLTLNPDRMVEMIAGIRKIVALEDPIGQILNQTKRKNGLVINKVRVPIGVIGVVYESRPNVTADVSVLCLKTSNAVILRGGSDAVHSNTAIANTLIEAGTRHGMPHGAIQLIANPQRESVQFLVQMPEYVDLVIPRGGEGLIKTIIELARVPIIKHYKGLCHTYVDAHANLQMAVNICENAKCQRPGVCNAMETLLIHQAVAEKFLPMVANCLKQHGVQLKGDEKSRKIIPTLEPATAQDWDTEYLDLILSIKIVKDLDEAIQHINQHGSHHSDAIISEDAAAQQKFCQAIDSAAVYVNASTRFTDGAEFGMGAEMGISTDKLHARGPMGLTELTTYKYVIEGHGQIRD